MKAWFKKQWKKVTAWFVGVLAAIGIGTGVVMAATVGFTYTPADSYTDGTPMPLSDIDLTRLYCDGVMVAEEPGADGGFSVILGFGTHVCDARHVVLNADQPESAPSNQVTKIVTPGQASPPSNLQ